jgi:SOS-response transcriptional repressor LexA
MVTVYRWGVDDTMMNEYLPRKTGGGWKKEDGLYPETEETFYWIERYIAQHGRAPTVREIMRGRRYSSPRRITEQLDRLEEEGYITRTNEVSRNIRLTANRPPVRSND